jgi:hypothetical protein
MSLSKNRLIKQEAERIVQLTNLLSLLRIDSADWQRIGFVRLWGFMDRIGVYGKQQP